MLFFAVCERAIRVFASTITLLKPTRNPPFFRGATLLFVYTVILLISLICSIALIALLLVPIALLIAISILIVPISLLIAISILFVLLVFATPLAPLLILLPGRSCSWRENFGDQFNAS
jgi:hypothetical protein